MGRFVVLVAVLAAAPLPGFAASVSPAVARHRVTDPQGANVAAVLAIDPLRVTLKVASSPGRSGSEVIVTERVFNAGRSPLATVTATLRASVSVVVSPPRSQVVGYLGAGRSRSVRWRLCAEQTAMVAVTGRASGFGSRQHDYFAYSPPVKFTAIASRRPC